MRYAMAIVACMAIVGWAVSAWGQVRDVTPTIVKVYDIQGQGGQLSETTVSPDGRRAYVLRPAVQAINVWEAASSWWAEVSAVVVGAVFIVVSWRTFRRAWRYTDVEGHDYCRKCGYDLSGNVSGRCSECGQILNKKLVRRGRARNRMLRPRLLWITALGMATAWLWLWGPRQSPAPELFAWYSTGLQEYAEVHRIAWLTTLSKPAQVVDELDVESGKILRRVAFAPMADVSYILVPEVGEQKVFMLRSGWIDAYDRISGHRTRLNGVAATSDPPPWCSLSPDKKTLYAKAPSDRLLAWDANTLAELPTIKLGPQSSTWWYIQPRPGGGFLNVVDEKEVQVLSADGRILRTFPTFAGLIDLNAVIAHDGRRMFTMEQHLVGGGYHQLPDIQEYDLELGQHVRTIAAPVDNGAMYISPDDRYLLTCGEVPLSRAWINIWDIASGKQIRHCELPGVWRVWNIKIWPDESRLAVQTWPNESLPDEPTRMFILDGKGLLN